MHDAAATPARGAEPRGTSPTPPPAARPSDRRAGEQRASNDRPGTTRPAGDRPGDERSADDRWATRPPDPAGLRPHRLRWLIQPWQLTLADGTPIVVRGARQADTDSLALMHGRCSTATLAERYHQPAPRVPRAMLRRLVSTELALVAIAGHARIVGFANIAPIDEETAEVSVLVEDSFQHRGIGTALIRHLAGGARLVGYRQLRATAPRADAWAARVLRDLGLTNVEALEEDVISAHLGHEALAALTPPGETIAAERID